MSCLSDFYKKKLGWILLRKLEPSEKTKKTLNWSEKYEIWWHPETGELLCDCPGFVFREKCKHVEVWKTKIKQVEFILKNSKDGKGVNS